MTQDSHTLNGAPAPHGECRHIRANALETRDSPLERSVVRVVAKEDEASQSARIHAGNRRARKRFR